MAFDDRTEGQFAERGLREMSDSNHRLRLPLLFPFQRYIVGSLLSSGPSFFITCICSSSAS